MKYLITFLAIILLGSCSASYHVKRARRLDPSLFQTQTIRTVDTLTVEIPTFIEKVQIDTLVEIRQLDPITKKEVIVKYKIQNDTIMIDCPDNEVVTVIETKTETIIIKPTFWQQIKYAVYLLVGLAGLYFLGRLALKFLL